MGKSYELQKDKIITKLHAPKNLVINCIKEKLIESQGVIKDFRIFWRNLNTKMSKAYGPW